MIALSTNASPNERIYNHNHHDHHNHHLHHHHHEHQQYDPISCSMTNSGNHNNNHHHHHDHHPQHHDYDEHTKSDTSSSSFTGPSTSNSGGHANKSRGAQTNNKGTRKKRTRTVFTPEQLRYLEWAFAEQIYLVGDDRFLVAEALGLTQSQVKIWFQNRRIKLRKQLERAAEKL